MGSKSRYVVWTLLFLGICALVVYKVRTNREWQNFDWAQLTTTLSRLDYRYLVLALFIIYSTYFLRSLRWREFLLPIKNTSLMNLLAATIIGFGGLALLGRPGELVRPYLISRKEDMPVSTQMAVWVLERIYDLSMIILIIGGVLYFSSAGQGMRGDQLTTLSHLREGAFTMLCLTVAGIVTLVFFRRYWKVWVPGLSARLKFLPQPVAAKLIQTLEDFGQGLSSLRSTRAFVMGVLYTALVWTSISIGYFLTLRAFGPPLSEFSFVSAVVVMGFAIAGSMFQVPGIGGGAQVFVILALTELFDVRPEVATSAAIVLWLLTFVAVVPMALVLVFREGLSWRKLRLIAASSQP